MSQRENLVQREKTDQALLGELIKQGVLELKPTIKKTGVSYAEVEEGLKETDSSKVSAVLKDLESRGALESKLFDRVLMCPDCGSPEVYSKYTCPRCHSINVEYTELLEHVKCGYIGPRNKFVKGSSLVCSGCQATLEEGTTEQRVAGKHDRQIEAAAYAGLKYLLIGTCYQCEKCGYRFDAPIIIHVCQNCRRDFTHQEARYVKVYEYRITEEAVGKIGRETPLLETIGRALREGGFATQLDAHLPGASGVQHPFNVVAERDGVRLVIDVSTGGKKSDVVSLLGKKVDVKPTEALLIDLSNSEDLASLGQVYGITVFNAANEKELEKELGSFLTKLSSRNSRRENGRGKTVKQKGKEVE